MIDTSETERREAVNWTFTNDRPIYLQLTERLEREIASGTLAPGSWVPPVRELAGKLGISPNTVQRAMYCLLYTSRCV